MDHYIYTPWFYFRGVNLSESEAEQDGDHNITELPQVYSGRGNMASQQSAVRLTEVRRDYTTKNFQSIAPSASSWHVPHGN